MNQTALITGASSGIGMELARLFAKSHYHLVLVARRQARLEKLAAELTARYPIEVTIIAKDLTLASAPDEIFAELRQKSIQPQILVNNAGTQVYGRFSETDLHRELQLIQVNLLALTHLTKLALPGMLQQGGGRILNVGSTGSFAPGPLNAVYCATKAYVLSFSEAIAKDLEGTGITVTTLCPGGTATEFAATAHIQNVRLFQNKVMEPAQVAAIGYRALMKGKKLTIAGLYNRLMIFSIRWMPRELILSISRRLMSPVNR